MEHEHDQKYSSGVYEDLLSTSDLGITLERVKDENQQLKMHVTSLEEDIQKLCNKITEMKQVEDNLIRNISELYKTAKNELNRKDRAIAELQAQLDDLVFKRNKRRLDSEEDQQNIPLKRQKRTNRNDEIDDNSKDIQLTERENSCSNHNDEKDTHNEHKQKERKSSYNSRDVRSKDSFKYSKEQRISNYKVDKRERSSSRERTYKNGRQNKYENRNEYQVKEGYRDKRYGDLRDSRERKDRHRTKDK